MSELFEFGKRVLAEQAFSAWIGAELQALTPGQAEILLAIRPEHKQQHGFVHGGVLSYLADNCLTFAGGSVLGDSVTSEFKINYLRPARGALLSARATVVSSGKRQAVCECKVFAVEGGEESLVALAQGTISKLQPET